MNKTERRIAAKKRKAETARGIAPQRSSENALAAGAASGGAVSRLGFRYSARH